MKGPNSPQRNGPLSWRGSDAVFLAVISFTRRSIMVIGRWNRLDIF